MRIRHRRFTISMAMLAVAALAVVFGLLARTARLLRTADEHVHRMAVFFSGPPSEGDQSGWASILHDSQGNPISERRHSYHGEMAAKYRMAATRPWLPVWPDPPAPE